MKKLILIVLLLTVTLSFVSASIGEEKLAFSETKAIHNYKITVQLKNPNESQNYGICTSDGPIRFGVSRELGNYPDQVSMAGHVMVVPKAFILTEDGEVVSSELYSLDLLSDLYFSDKTSGRAYPGTVVYKANQTVWCKDTSCLDGAKYGEWYNFYGNWYPKPGYWYTSYVKADWDVLLNSFPEESKTGECKLGFKDKDGNLIYVAATLSVLGNCTADDCHMLTVSSSGTVSTKNEYKFETKTLFEDPNETSTIKYKVEVIKIMKDGEEVENNDLITTYPDGDNGFLYTPGYIYYLKVSNPTVNTMDSYTLVYDATVDKVQNIKIYNTNPNYSNLSDGKLIFRVGPSVHSWNYLLEGSTIVAKCFHNYCQHAIVPIRLALNIPMTQTVLVNYVPDNATNKNLSWSSENPKIAKSLYGDTIIGVNPGSVRLEAITTDGSGQHDDVDVIVREKYSTLDVFKNVSEISIGFRCNDLFFIAVFTCNGTSYTCQKVLVKDYREKYFVDKTSKYSSVFTAQMEEVSGGKKFNFSMGTGSLEVSSADDSYFISNTGTDPGITKMLYFAVDGNDIFENLTQEIRFI